MYLNKGKCLLEIIVNGILTLIFGWNALVMAFGLLLIETGQVGKNRDIDSIGVVILVTFAVLFIFFFQRLRIPFMAIKMSRLFETDKDGLVSVIDLAEQLKKRQSKLIAVFIKCVGKGFLVNCGIFAVDPTYIILGNGAKTIGERYRVVRCTSCGATNVNRIGYENKCKYCDSRL